MPAAVALAIALSLGTGLAAQAAASSGTAESASSLFPGTDSKEPVNIEANRLEYSEKDQKAVYIGNVLVQQGETTLKCSKLTILLDKQPNGAAPANAKAAAAMPAAPTSGQVKHMDIEGPVTIFSKDQVGTGDRGEFDRAQNKVFLIGHVVLTQGTNITKGDKLTYDMATKLAVVESDNGTGRVSGYFVPGSGDAGKKADKTGTEKSADAKTATGKPPVKPPRAKPAKKPDGSG